MAINYFCDLNSALSLSVQNTRIRKTLFFSEQDMLHPAITESIRINLHRELYCTNAISLQVINSIYPSFNALSREISREVILYLQAAMYYFVYYINTRRLYRQP